MARGTEEQEQTPDVGADFPYAMLMTHPAWSVLDNALAELESNDDLELRTARRYVIGFLIQQMIEQGQIPPAIVSSPGAPHAIQQKYRWVLEIEGRFKVGYSEPSRKLKSSK